MVRNHPSTSRRTHTTLCTCVQPAPRLGCPHKDGEGVHSARKRRFSVHWGGLPSGPLPNFGYNVWVTTGLFPPVPHLPGPAPLEYLAGRWCCVGVALARPAAARWPAVPTAESPPGGGVLECTPAPALDACVGHRRGGWPGSVAGVFLGAEQSERPRASASARYVRPLFAAARPPRPGFPLRLCRSCRASPLLFLCGMLPLCRGRLLTGLARAGLGSDAFVFFACALRS